MRASCRSELQSSDPGRGFLGLVLDDYGTTWRKKVLLIAASRYMLDLFPTRHFRRQCDGRDEAAESSELQLSSGDE